jgi:3-dehydroquinate synthase
MKEKTIKVKLKDNSYEIFLKQGIISKVGDYIKDVGIGKKILIVTQDKIPKIYLEQVKKSLKKYDYKTFAVSLSSGESYKNLSSLLKILNIAIKNKLERNDSLLALGGGVISDLTGFAASIYLRGINFVCVPTTLLGMVDAAVGGKTAINIKEGKNLIGTFYQPKLILIDPACLKTLSKKEFLVGMGEVIKYALLEITAKKTFKDKRFFNYLKNIKNKILKLNPSVLLKIIEHSVSIKANIVSKDEKESDLRAILNLGHTFGHGIEQAYNYKKYTHGEAVSIGTCLACKLSNNLKLFSDKDTNNVIKLISDFGLPTKLANLKLLNKIIKSMQHDKKIKDGNLRLIIPANKIGNVKIISGIGIKDIIKVFRQHHN